MVSNVFLIPRTDVTVVLLAECGLVLPGVCIVCWEKQVAYKMLLLGRNHITQRTKLTINVLSLTDYLNKLSEHIGTTTLLPPVKPAPTVSVIFLRTLYPLLHLQWVSRRIPGTEGLRQDTLWSLCWGNSWGHWRYTGFFFPLLKHTSIQKLKTLQGKTSKHCN